MTESLFKFPLGNWETICCTNMRTSSPSYWTWELFGWSSLQHKSHQSVQVRQKITKWKYFLVISTRAGVLTLYKCWLDEYHNWRESSDQMSVSKLFQLKFFNELKRSKISLATNSSKENFSHCKTLFHYNAERVALPSLIIVDISSWPFLLSSNNLQSGQLRHLVNKNHHKDSAVEVPTNNAAS